jgi:hypothetical protein
VNEVEWRISPQVFSDLHSIIAKHGMGIPQLDDEMRKELFGDRLIGPDAAAMEIVEKYGLRVGIPLRIVVDYKLDGYEKPKYEYGEN